MIVVIGLIIFLIYITYNIIYYGCPNTISATYYNNKYNKLLFSIVLLFISFSVMPELIKYSSTSFSRWLSIFSGIGLCLVSVAPEFKEDFTRKFHILGAIISFISSQLWIIFNNPETLYIWLILPLVCLEYKENNTLELDRPIYFIELISFLEIYSILL